MNYYDRELITFFHKHNIDYKKNDYTPCFDWLEKVFPGDSSSLIDRVSNNNNKQLFNLNYKDEQSTAETAYKIIVNNKLCGKAIYFGDNLDNAYIIDLEKTDCHIKTLFTLTPQNQYLLDEKKQWLLHLSFYNEVLFCYPINPP